MLLSDTKLSFFTVSTLGLQLPCNEVRTITRKLLVSKSQICNGKGL